MKKRVRFWVGLVVVLSLAAAGLGPWMRPRAALLGRNAPRPGAGSGVAGVVAAQNGRPVGSNAPAYGPANFIWIAPGTFRLGSAETEKDREVNEGPPTQVILTHGFWMGRAPVTQREYQAVMGENPSYFKGDAERPVDSVSWYDAVDYGRKLTTQERAAGRLPASYCYRLPTEAEWEYACRAGTTTRFYYGDDSEYAQLGAYAWYNVNSAGTTHPVRQKLANPWGLCDLDGNVWQWCLDWYGAYPGGKVSDPQGAAAGASRVLRGSSWFGVAWYCRSAYRCFDSPGFQANFIGFRVLLAPSR